MQQACKHENTVKVEQEFLNSLITEETHICCFCGAEFAKSKKQTEMKKMGYNPQKSMLGEDKSLLPKDTILEAEIGQINDGTVKDFVKNTDKWQGDIKGPAINVVLEVKNGEEKIEMSQVFTYTEENGTTIYTPKSNLGKYVKKYGGLPVVGQKVKIITNSDGFGKVKLE